jgi:probable rRNA maturation factor
MKYRVHIRTDPPFRRWRTGLPRAARAALDHAGAPSGEVSIVLSDDQRVRELHRTFLGDDAPTDVLSFPDGAVDPESGLPYHGDVVIAVPRATRQAAEAGHSLEAELTLLAVHGILHLLGHDHAEPIARERMWGLQTQILHALGAQVADGEIGS